VNKNISINHTAMTSRIRANRCKSKRNTDRSEKSSSTCIGTVFPLASLATPTGAPGVVLGTRVPPGGDRDLGSRRARASMQAETARGPAQPTPRRSAGTSCGRLPSAPRAASRASSDGVRVSAESPSSFERAGWNASEFLDRVLEGSEGVAPCLQCVSRGVKHEYHSRSHFKCTVYLFQSSNRATQACPNRMGIRLY